MTKNADVQANAAFKIRQDAAEASYPWMRDGSMPHTREDLIAEAVALVALLCALGIGLLIAMLPVPAQAAPSTGRASSQRIGSTGGAGDGVGVEVGTPAFARASIVSISAP